MSLYAWKYGGDNTVVYTTSDEPSGGDLICKSNGIPYEESELYILYGGSTTASVNPYISSVSIDPETMLPYLKCLALPEGMSRPLPTNFMRYSDGDILPISRLKHAGVTYEIEDEKARQDIATKQDVLTTQTAYSAKGSATKVPQITTNILGQVTNITEVTISQPTVNDATLTIQQNGTAVTTFSANASSAATANINTTVVKFRDWSNN